MTEMWHAGDLPWLWWSVAPTYELTEISREYFNAAASDVGILSHATRTSPKRTVLTNGARVQFRSADDPGNLTGRPIAGALGDEFTSYSSEAMKNLFARRLETVRHGWGKYRFIGNVTDLGCAGESVWKQAEHDPRTTLIRWTWRTRALEIECLCCDGGIVPELGTGAQHADDCSRGVYVREVELAADRISRSEFLATFEAEWESVNELPVYDFVRDLHVNAAVEVRDYVPLDLSCDWNVDPMCWVVGQHHGEESWAADEIVTSGGAHTDEAAREFVRRYGDKRQHVNVYGDATGKSRDTRSHTNDYEILLRELKPHFAHVSLLVPLANGSVKLRTNTFNARLLSASRRVVRYQIHPRCERLIRDLAKVSKLPGTDEIDKRDKTLTHASDAEGYRLVWIYGTAEGKCYTSSTSTSTSSPSLMDIRS